MEQISHHMNGMRASKNPVIISSKYNTKTSTTQFSFYPQKEEPNHQKITEELLRNINYMHHFQQI